MKKVFSIVLAGLMLLSIIGCMGTQVDPGGSPGSGNESGTPDDSGLGVPEVPAGVVNPENPPEGRELPPMNTTDPITLYYATWDDLEMAEVLARYFTAKYPNINVVVVHPGDTGSYMSALLTMAANGEMPDVWQSLEIATPINNGWFYDFTDFWNNDPDTDLYLTSLFSSLSLDKKAV